MAQPNHRLGLRRSCAHGICGSDTMLINGRNRLACKVLIKDPFFEHYRSVQPYLINTGPPPAGASAVPGGPAALFRCRAIFNCADACPRGIEVTRARV